MAGLPMPETDQKVLLNPITQLTAAVNTLREPNSPQSPDNQSTDNLINALVQYGERAVTTLRSCVIPPGTTDVPTIVSYIEERSDFFPHPNIISLEELIRDAIPRIQKPGFPVNLYYRLLRVLGTVQTDVFNRLPVDLRDIVTNYISKGTNLVALPPVNKNAPIADWALYNLLAQSPHVEELTDESSPDKPKKRMCFRGATVAPDVYCIVTFDKDFTPPPYEKPNETLSLGNFSGHPRIKIGFEFTPQAIAQMYLASRLE